MATLQRGYLLIFSACFCGCALILEGRPELDAVEAAFYYDPHSASIPSAYSVKLPVFRKIRQVDIHSLDPIRGTDNYVRERVDSRKLVKEINTTV